VASLSASSLHQDSGTFTISGADWAVANSSWTLTRKSGGGSTIALTNIGTAVQHTAPSGSGNFVLNYSDGPSGAGSATGIVYVTASTFATGNGVQITLPADTSVRTGTIYWGESGTTGRLTATLSDGSASAATHTVAAATDAQNFGFISTIQWQAGSASQTLTVKLTTDVTVDGQDEIAFQGVAWNFLVTGSGTSTQAANASSASGSVSISGSSSDSQQKNASSASGGAAISGSASATQAKNISVVVGAVAISGTAAANQASNTASGSGLVLVSGSGASTQQKNTSAASGSASISGSASSTQALNTSNASGAIGNVSQGSGASTQAANVSSASGGVIVAGSSASTQSKNVATATGASIVSGSASSVQTANVSAASGSVGFAGISGAGASTQAKNVSLTVGTVAVSGSASSVQAANSDSASGDAPVSCIASAVQQPNASAGLGFIGAVIAAPPVTFPVYGERRVFSAPSESRITPIPAERRIVKVAA
jgi:hypothetical protein